MKSLIKVATIGFLISIFGLAFSTASAEGTLEDFIRGTWLTFISTNTTYFHCVPGLTHKDPDQVNWKKEYDLLHGIHVNLIDAFLVFDHFWMTEVCNKYKGEIKMRIGYEGGGDSLNVGFWTYPWSSPYPRWWDYKLNQYAWTTGFEKAAQYWNLKYTDETGIFGYGLAHELTYGGDNLDTTYLKYEIINFMASTIDVVDDDVNHFTSVVNGPRGSMIPIKSFFPDRVPNLDLYEYFDYPYRWRGLKISGESFQEVVDGLTARYDSIYTIFTEPNKIPWVAIIQTYTDMSKREGSACECIPVLHGVDTVGGYWTNWNVKPGDSRFPSREEIRLQSFLAISRGAKGIMCFTHGPSISPDWGPFFGLIDYNGGVENVRRPWSPLNDPAYGNFAFNYSSIDITPYGHIAELFTELAQMGQLLVKLRITSIASYGISDTLVWVNNNASDWLVKLTDPTYGDTALHYWEATTFVDTSTVRSPNYFMLVNKVTSVGDHDSDTLNWAPAPYRDVLVMFTSSIGSTPIVQDIYSEEIWVFTKSDSINQGRQWWTFTDSVGPGDGNIYRVTNSNVSSDSTVIQDFLSVQNYPNPFNASTEIKFLLPAQSYIRLDVFNILGQKTATLLEGRFNSGEHSIIWDTGDFPSGVYFARLETADHFESIRMVLLK